MTVSRVYDRDSETGRVLQFIENPGSKLLLVVGESGCGKSIVVRKALEIAVRKTTITENSILSYRFEASDIEDEAQRFPQHLIDQYNKLRPSWFIESWMRKRGVIPESWELQLSFASFSFPAINLRDPYKSDLFFSRLNKVVGSRFRIFRLENVENFVAQHNLAILERLAGEPGGPKIILEIGTLTAKAESATQFFKQKCRHEVLQINLFNPTQTSEYFRFVHERSVPTSLVQISRGNALAIRHYGTALAELPIGGKVRERLQGFSPEAMIVLWCLTALRGSAEISFLKAVSQLGSSFEPALIALRQAEVVHLEHEFRITFAHSLFGGYFNSKVFAQDVNLFGRRRLIDHLESQPHLSTADTHELARQYHALGDFETAWVWAEKTVISCYRQEDFRTVLDLTEILDGPGNSSPKIGRRIDLLLLQTAIRLGDTASAIQRIDKIESVSDGVAILLRAQVYYLTNRFTEGAKLCGTIASKAGDLFLSARALGVRAACLIALGRHTEAANDFAVAKRIAETSKDEQLDLELLRLSPEIEPPIVWKMRFEELKKSNIPDKYPYLYAKCLHNFGAFMLLESCGRTGMDELKIAAALFEAGGYPEYSYAAAMSAAALLLEGETDKARRLLEESEIWCHEQYDRFAFKTNLGVAAALDGDWGGAEHYFNEAEKAFKEAAFPLNDPYFTFQATHNRALASAARGDFESALQLLQSISVPSNCYDFDAKVMRQQQFIDLFQNQRFPTSDDCPDIGQRWATRNCMLEVATLQFFDFNVNVLSPDLFRC